MHNAKKIGHDAGRADARDLLAGIIAWRNELGELGQDLERMLRSAGIEPSIPSGRSLYSPPDAERH